MNGYAVKSDIWKNKAIYFIIIFIFTVGVSLGALTVNFLTPEQSNNIIEYINNFIDIIGSNEINKAETFRISVFNNLKFLGFIYFLSYTIIGIPFIIGFTAVRGFITGFTVGMFIKYFKVNGIFLSLAGVLPQNFIFVPCYIFLGIFSIKFSLDLLSALKRIDKNFKSKIFIYNFSILIILILIIFGSLIETYISSELIKRTIPLIF